MPDQVDWRAIEREAGPGQAVGRLLRDQRESRGLDLTQVEKSIRIRRAHLEAMQPWQGGGDMILAVRFDGTIYDTGPKIGFLLANVAYGLGRDDLAPALKAGIAKLI